MSSYNIVCDMKSSGHGSEKIEWKNLTKEEVVKVESVMANYMEDLAKKNMQRLKGDIADPVELDRVGSTFNIDTSCVITKDGAEWASTGIRMWNLTPMHLTILSFLFHQHLNNLGRKIRSKMTVTR